MARPIVLYDQTNTRNIRTRSVINPTYKKAVVPPTTAPAAPPSTPKSLQPYEKFLVLDVEATCHRGTSFDFPNEIIEFPVSLLQWKDRTENCHASQLEVVGEFRSFVRPTWKPTLSQFCKDLTGITQEQVDIAPTFPEVLARFHKFLVKHGLVDEQTGERRVRFCWCSDGPFDVRDFVVKQCFISNIPIPHWLRGDILDVRLAVNYWLGVQALQRPESGPRDFPRRRSLNIPSQLEVLGLPVFEGRQHCGIDDTRNLAKIVTELARRGVCLLPNTAIEPYRRWQWMGKRGQILEEYCNPQVFR
ncbi:hypothetical protein BDN72DRAFT_869441 [Pluteus cervinus]|uniref:Uncharacterized protein n=1 Tax=Pluteus cervinus TaxID=181527 RepID=A0ACD3B3R3_9AGAR|nr:hypothetical protein BDN72DRAFT_869441 [Pluteus cervinus]